ncbi:MAG TPA: DUF1643 domain-containing protein [Azospirillum sp.]
MSETLSDAAALPRGWTLDALALLSPDGRHRYWLRRRLSSHGAPFVLAMLNPSTADAERNDPTINRALGFAHAVLASDLGVVNLFGYRSTDPDALFGGVDDPVGPDNDAVIRAAAAFCRARGGVFVCAWGSAGTTKAQRHRVRARADAVLAILADAGVTPHVLAVSAKTGAPCHPLYLPAALRPVPWAGHRP